MASLLSPLYIAEISPAGLRGRFVSLNQLTIVIGILMAYFSNYLLVGVGEDNWRWMLASEGAPAVLFFVLLFLVPESPRYLAKVGEDAPAIKILTRVEGAEKAKRTMAEIRGTLSSEVKSRIRDLFRPRLQRVLVIGVVLAVLQQWSGINVIFFYAPDIFTKIGVGIDSALFQTVLLGLTNLIFTFVALWLVDRTGRKGLLLVGSIGMSLCYACIGFFYRSGASESVYLLVLSVITIAFYASSLAPVTWVMISEIFPNRFRGAAMAIATLFLWIACYVLTVTFPVLVEAIGSTYTFWMYGVICLFGFLYIWRFVPETKGKSLEQLEKELAR
jgi:sugar porter (SP) family MFS transporter